MLSRILRLIKVFLDWTFGRPTGTIRLVDRNGRRVEFIQTPRDVCRRFVRLCDETFHGDPVDHMAAAWSQLYLDAVDARNGSTLLACRRLVELCDDDYFGTSPDEMSIEWQTLYKAARRVVDHDRRSPFRKERNS